jgi:hypothetical protein
MWQWANTSVQTTVDDCVVLLGLEDGKYYSLNRTASEIWNLLETPAGLEDIKRGLDAIFDLPRDGIEDSIMQSIDYFRERALIKEV